MLRRHASGPIMWEDWEQRGAVAAVCYGPQPTTGVGVDGYVGQLDVIDCALLAVMFGESRNGR
jgi:hypothetical protein